MHQRQYELYRHQLASKLGKRETEMTAQEVLDLLFDDEGDYVVYHRGNPYDKISVVQRLNRFWIVPIWLICTPFLFIATGSGYINPNTKLAKILSKLTGI